MGMYICQRESDSFIKAVTSELSLMEEALRPKRTQGAEGAAVYVLWEANFAIRFIPNLDSNSSPCDRRQVTLSF